jgi:hypothetical protein
MITTDRPGIVIASNDVILDLGGQTISGVAPKTGTGIEIRNVQGVTVRNGNLVDLAFGVVVNSSNNVRLEQLMIRGQGLVVNAPPPETGVMIVQSKNVVVQHNALYNVGLGIFVRGGQSGGNRIAFNTITAGTNGVLGICYNPTPSDPQGPVGDLIYQNVIHGFGIGFQASSTSRVNVLQENTIFYRIAAVDLQNVSNIDADNRKVLLP